MFFFASGTYVGFHYGDGPIGFINLAYRTTHYKREEPPRQYVNDLSELKKKETQDALIQSVEYTSDTSSPLASTPPRLTEVKKQKNELTPEKEITRYGVKKRPLVKKQQPKSKRQKTAENQG